METPTDLKFTDFELPISQLFRKANTGPMNRSWTRVQFPIPDNWEASVKVEQWLNDNTPSKWASYNYLDPKGKQRSDYIMVVRFEDKNDALMFKLRGGHQAWEIR